MSPAGAAPAPPIQVKSLRKSFGNRKVLDGIDIEVEQGETLAVLGRSGTGKSVLLKLIIGLQQPDSGSVLIQGQDVCSASREQLDALRKQVGFMFQSAALYDSLTVEENVAFPLLRHGDMSDAQRKRRVNELLSSVGLEKDGRKMPSDLSGGMQKRVGLARALALAPHILLFDEPTAGLDPITSGEICELIVSLQKDRQLTSIIVTHDIHGARTVADRLALMRDGSIVAEGSFAQLRKSRNRFVAQFIGTESP